MAATTARAQPSARIEYETPAALACPDVAELGALVASRVGAQPYTDDGTWLVRVHIVEGQGLLVARVELVGPDGVSRGERVVESTGDCSALLSSVALTLSLVHDVMEEEERQLHESDQGAAVLAPESTEPTEPEQATQSTEPALPNQDAVPPEPVAAPAVGVWGGGGLLLGWGLLPGASVGLRTVLGVGGARGELRLSVRADLPRPVATGAVSYQLGWVLGAVAGCARWGVGTLCVKTRVALAYVPRSGDDGEGHRRSVGAAVGAELGLRLWRRGNVDIQGYVDLAVPVRRTTVTVQDTSVFRQRPVDAGVGVEVLWGRP